VGDAAAWQQAGPVRRSGNGSLAATRGAQLSAQGLLPEGPAPPGEGASGSLAHWPTPARPANATIAADVTARQHAAVGISSGAGPHSGRRSGFGTRGKAGCRRAWKQHRASDAGFVPRAQDLPGLGGISPPLAAVRTPGTRGVARSRKKPGVWPAPLAPKPSRLRDAQRPSEAPAWAGASGPAESSAGRPGEGDCRPVTS